MLNLRSATAATLLALAAACGSDTAATTDPGTKPPTTASVAAVDVTPPTAEVIAGPIAKLSATPRDVAGNALSGRTVSWSSSNANIASVDNNGMVTGVAAGNATITASSEGKNAAASITVKAEAPAVSVASVSIVAAPDTIEAWDPATMRALTCGVAAATGAAYCWGANSIGQTGDGQKINYGNVFVSTPQQAVGGLAFKSVSLGNQYACGVTMAGQGYCWGSNSTKLGAGPTNDSSSPVAVAGGYAFQSISAGALHACGVATSNAVYCWGRNGNGELGVAALNGSSASDIPVRAGGNFTASEVSAAGTGTGSSGHTCAISVDRLTAYCFGRNDVGQLGDGTTTAASTANATPVIIVGQKPL